MPKFRIQSLPDHFVEGVNCPYCKQPSLGVDKTYVYEEMTHARFYFRCVNDDCVTNFISHASFEIDWILQGLLDVEARPGTTWSNATGFERAEQSLPDT